MTLANYLSFVDAEYSTTQKAGLLRKVLVQAVDYCQYCIDRLTEYRRGEWTGRVPERPGWYQSPGSNDFRLALDPSKPW